MAIVNKNKKAGYQSSGQALVEYLLIFAIVLFLALKFVQSIGMMMDYTYGRLRKVLSDELSVGLCPEGVPSKYCVHKSGSYQN